MRWSAAAVIVVSMAAPAEGFDNNRRGFIVNLGVGASATSTYKRFVYEGHQYSRTNRQNAASLVTDMSLGFGASDHILIFVFDHENWFRANNGYGEVVATSSSQTGISISGFLSNKAPSWMLMGGVGYSHWDTFGNGENFLDGFGLLLGGGYEFRSHWVAEATLGYGGPSRRFTDGTKEVRPTSSLGVSLNYLAY